MLARESSRWDVEDVVSCLRYYAGLAEGLEEQVQLSTPQQKLDVGDEEYAVRVRYEPCGVVALIVPFNYPLLMAIWKVQNWPNAPAAPLELCKESAVPGAHAGCCSLDACVGGTSLSSGLHLRAKTKREYAAHCHGAGSASSEHCSGHAARSA